VELHCLPTQCKGLAAVTTTHTGCILAMIAISTLDSDTGVIHMSGACQAQAGATGQSFIVLTPQPQFLHLKNMTT